MTNNQKRLRELRERQSRERGRMAELAQLENLSDEHRAELDGIEKGTADLKRQLRAATIAVETEEAEQREAGAAARQPEGDAEAHERAELRRKVKFGSYIAAAIEQRSADGAELEYNAALGIAGNRFPLELLAPPEQRAARIEARATTDVDTMTTPRRWLDRLFAGTAATRLGITMESAPVGVASYPVTTAGASAAQRARSTDSAAEAAWTVGVNTIINSTADNMTLAAFLRMAGLSWMARGEIDRRGRGRCGLGSGRADPRSVQRCGERRGRVDPLLPVGLCLAAHGELRPNQIRDVGPAMTVERRPSATELRVEGRKLSGTVMRYGEVSPSHRGRFEPGSLRMAESVHLDLHHDIERAVAWHPGGGLTLDNGRDALTMRAEPTASPWAV